MLQRPALSLLGDRGALLHFSVVPVYQSGIISSGSLLLDCPLHPHISQVCSDPCSAVSISSLLCHSCLSYITLSSVVLHPTFHGRVSASCDPLFSFLIQQVSLKGPLHWHLKFHTFQSFFCSYFFFSFFCHCIILFCHAPIRSK